MLCTFDYWEFVQNVGVHEISAISDSVKYAVILSISNRASNATNGMRLLFKQERCDH
jgi:hypothetical protein